MDLTANTPSERPEVSIVARRRTKRKSRQDEIRQAEQLEENNLLNLSKLFDRNLLAELTTWMDRLRRVIEQKDRHSFELMGPYTNSLWHQMSFVDDCIIVDSRLAVPGQLRPAVLKRIHRGHPRQEAMLDVSRYLWWPQMHKNVVNMAEEIRSCTRYDKEHLERSALTASQLKKRIDQSRDNVIIVRKGQSSREVSPLFETEVESAKDKDRAKELKTLLEASARWNATRGDTSANDLRRIVDEMSTINLDLRKELLYSWKNGFIKDKPQEDEPRSPNLLRKDENRKSGKALTNPLKGKVQSETPHTVKTAAGAVIEKATSLKQKLTPVSRRKKSKERQRK